MMNDQEKQEYLRQHWELYWAEELARAIVRTQDRMIPHIADMAMEEVVRDFIKEHLP